jgi:hypothetical protein
MPASRRVPARLSPEGSETRHLVSYCSKDARPGAWGARADEPGQRRSAERRYRARRDAGTICPARPALSRLVPRCPTCDFFWDKAGQCQGRQHAIPPARGKRVWQNPQAAGGACTQYEEGTRCGARGAGQGWSHPVALSRSRSNQKKLKRWERECFSRGMRSDAMLRAPMARERIICKTEPSC